MRTPPHAKKVFEGVIWDVYHWQQEMFDGSFETFEMLKRKNTVEVVATMNGKVLIAEQEQPGKDFFYSPFGGRQEENEPPEETAKRELLEETGLKAGKLKLWNKFDNKNIDWEHFVFIGKNCKKVGQQQLDSGEKIKIKELSFEEWLDILDDKNWRGEKISNLMFRMKQEPEKLKEFRDLLGV